jgi:hypothetical protein
MKLNEAFCQSEMWCDRRKSGGCIDRYRTAFVGASRMTYGAFDAAHYTFGETSRRNPSAE